VSTHACKFPLKSPLPKAMVRRPKHEIMRKRILLGVGVGVGKPSMTYPIAIIIRPTRIVDLYFLDLSAIRPPTKARA